MTGAVIAGLYAFPYFAVLTYGGQALIFIAIVLSMIVHAMMYGPQAALIGESFPTHLRYGGAGLGYQLASVFAGGPAPLVATWLLHETGTPYSISVYIVVAAVITVVCCLALADRSRVEHRRRDGLQSRLNKAAGAHNVVLIGAGLDAISSSTARLRTTSRLSRSAISSTVAWIRPITPGGW